ncbi:MAG: response regulator [Proteobacteria bacterium]|nr:response regulator [Pseudomonadota bacterium]
MKHCLVIDDSRVIRKVACRILEDMHFETSEADDGPAALEICRTKMPDVILLDWTMPNMTATDFLRVLRREYGGKHPIVVFCTTENDAVQINEALNAGANEYILKPFDGDDLRSKLAQVGAV